MLSLHVSFFHLFFMNSSKIRNQLWRLVGEIPFIWIFIDCKANQKHANEFLQLYIFGWKSDGKKINFFVLKFYWFFFFWCFDRFWWKISFRFSGLTLIRKNIFTSNCGHFISVGDVIRWKELNYGQMYVFFTYSFCQSWKK